MRRLSTSFAILSALTLFAFGCPPEQPSDDTGTTEDAADAEEPPDASDTGDEDDDAGDASEPDDAGVDAMDTSDPDDADETDDAGDTGDDTGDTVEDTTEGDDVADGGETTDTTDEDTTDATDDTGDTTGDDATDATTDVSDTTTDVTDSTTDVSDTSDDVQSDTSDATTDTGSDAVTESGGLVITEFMADPDALADAEGEWFEVYNPSSSAFSLGSCTIKDRGTDSHTISGTVDVGPGEYVTLANSNAPGFGTPDYVYGGDITLANTGDEIIISCSGSTIDVVDYSGWSSGPSTGASKGLDPGARDATSNNNESNWCDQTSNQGNGDLGTPGAGNDSC